MATIYNFPGVERQESKAERSDYLAKQRAWFEAYLMGCGISGLQYDHIMERVDTLAMTCLKVGYSSGRKSVLSERAVAEG